MKIKYLLPLAFLLPLCFFTSCDEYDDEEITYVATFPASGTWAVTFNIETSPGQFEQVADPANLSVYNTAANTPDRMWIDDLHHFWDFKVNVPLNKADLSFSANAVQNVAYESQVTITDGKVFVMGTQVNGNPADSIYFRASFSDDGTPTDPDPYGTIYHIFGHRAF
jgi:hypothetical protein